MANLRGLCYVVASSFGRDSSFATNLSIHFRLATCKKDQGSLDDATGQRVNLLKPEMKSWS